MQYSILTTGSVVDKVSAVGLAIDRLCTPTPQADGLFWADQVCVGLGPAGRTEANEEDEEGDQKHHCCHLAPHTLLTVQLHDVSLPASNT